MASPSHSRPLHHPTLRCSFIGKNQDTTTQYRGIKYASIPGRWQDSIPLNTLPTNPSTNTFDATHFGPSCPQHPNAQAWDLSLVGNVTLPCEEGQGPTEKMHEFECLHLNITVPHQEHIPKDANGTPLPLPVLVWVHGGALSMGSNSWPQYNLAPLIAHSVHIGKPVIGVAVNYRLGPLGFLASGKRNVAGNFGFKDQANAFRWIRRHIEGFGGDAGNVTAVGESAGAISLSTLLCAEGEKEGRLFDRVVLMSGEVTLRGPRGWGWHERMFEEQERVLGLKGRELWEMDAVEMCKKLPLAQHFCPLVDGESGWFGGRRVDFGVLIDGRDERGKREWCREFVVGDMADDGTVLKPRIIDSPDTLKHLHQNCAQHLTPAESNALLSAYGIPLPTSTVSKTNKLTPRIRQNLLNLTSDLRFHLPPVLAHRGLTSRSRLLSQFQNKQPQRVSRYHIHIPNPFPGPFKNTASHELDVALLLGNFHSHPSLSSHDQKLYANLGDEMRNIFISYAWGQGWGISPSSTSLPLPLSSSSNRRRNPPKNILHPPPRPLPPPPPRPLKNPRRVRPLLLHDERHARPDSELLPSNRLQSEPAQEDAEVETAEEAHDPGHGHGELDLVTVFTAGGTRRMSAREYDRVFRRGRGELLCSFAQPERLWRLVEGWQGVSPDEESDGAENDGYGDSRVSGRYAGRERARL